MTDRTKTAKSTWATLPFHALLALMALVIAASAFPLAAVVPDAGAAEETVPAIGSEIIVVLEKGDDPQAAAAAMGVEVKHVYRHVFNGFAGTVTGDAPVTASTPVCVIAPVPASAFSVVPTVVAPKVTPVPLAVSDVVVAPSTVSRPVALSVAWFGVVRCTVSAVPLVSCTSPVELALIAPTKWLLISPETTRR